MTAAARWISCSRVASIEMSVTWVAGTAGSGGIPMYAPTDNVGDCLRKVLRSQGA